MPTILNNSCINRVPKVKKVKLTSNDLTAMTVTPYDLLILKDGQLSRVPILAILFAPDTCDYIGKLLISGPSYTCECSTSWIDDSSNSFYLLFSSSISIDKLSLSVSEDFEVGVNRPDLELHLYYFEESVTVDFNVDYISS